ncbi:MAG TPA: hypothetical protein EYP85_16365 [Armatimonadetes bacterium]|nr:hypothetical protein [Armatimonadota bacterium]
MAQNIHLVPEGDNPLHRLYEQAREGEAGLPPGWFHISEESDVLIVDHVAVLFFKRDEEAGPQVWLGFDSDAHPNHVAQLASFLTAQGVDYVFAQMAMFGHYGERLWADPEKGTMLFETHLSDTKYLRVIAEQGYKPIPYKDGTYRLVRL